MYRHQASGDIKTIDALDASYNKLTKNTKQKRNFWQPILNIFLFSLTKIFRKYYSIHEKFINEFRLFDNVVINLTKLPSPVD